MNEWETEDLLIQLNRRMNRAEEEFDFGSLEPAVAHYRIACNLLGEFMRRAKASKSCERAKQAVGASVRLNDIKRKLEV